VKPSGKHCSRYHFGFWWGFDHPTKTVRQARKLKNCIRLFFEILIAPAFTEIALTVLKGKKKKQEFLFGFRNELQNLRFDEDLAQWRNPARIRIWLLRQRLISSGRYQKGLLYRCRGKMPLVFAGKNLVSILNPTLSSLVQRTTSVFKRSWGKLPEMDGFASAIEKSEGIWL